MLHVKVAHRQACPHTNSDMSLGQCLSGASPSSHRAVISTYLPVCLIFLHGYFLPSLLEVVIRAMVAMTVF